MATENVTKAIEADVGIKFFEFSHEAIPLSFTLTKSEAGIIAYTVFASFLVFVAYWLSCMGGEKKVNKILKTMGLK